MASESIDFLNESYSDAIMAVVDADIPQNNEELNLDKNHALKTYHCLQSLIPYHLESENWYIARSRLCQTMHIKNEAFNQGFAQQMWRGLTTKSRYHLLIGLNKM